MAVAVPMVVGYVAKQNISPAGLAQQSKMAFQASPEADALFKNLMAIKWVDHVLNKIFSCNFLLRDQQDFKKGFLSFYNDFNSTSANGYLARSRNKQEAIAKEEVYYGKPTEK